MDHAGRSSQYVVPPSRVALDHRSAASHVWKYSSPRVQYRLHALRLRRALHTGEQERQRERAKQNRCARNELPSLPKISRLPPHRQSSPPTDCNVQMRVEFPWVAASVYNCFTYFASLLLCRATLLVFPV